MLIVNAFAEEEHLFETAGGSSEVSGEEGSPSEAAVILGELVEKRTADTKYYRMSDGTYQVLQYPQAVHYEAGERISRTITGENGQAITTRYIYNGGILAGQSWDDGKTLEFYYDNNGEYFGFRYNNAEYYYLRNGQNDVTGIVDSTGVVVVKYSYDAWGKQLSVTDGAGNPITDADHVGMINPIRYRGYCYETETGYYWLKTRYYSSEMQRFLNADGYISTGQGMLGTNLFAYCGNNPVNRFDPTGKSWVSTIVAVIVIVATVVAILTNFESMPTPVPPVTEPSIPPGGTSVYKGTPRICTDGSDGTKVPDAYWQPYTALSLWTATTITTLDAYQMPYVVMPGVGSANKGDKAILINWDTGQSVTCIVGEVGNAAKGWGEVSIAAIWATGYPGHMTANHASGISSNYEIILYPGVSYGYDWSWGCRKIER